MDKIEQIKKHTTMQFTERTQTYYRKCKNGEIRYREMVIGEDPIINHKTHQFKKWCVDKDGFRWHRCKMVY